MSDIQSKVHYYEVSMKFEEVLKNEDFFSIAKKATRTFSDDLSQDEIKTCIMSAMWQATNKFDESRNIKFSTYLYQSVLYECLKQKKYLVKENNKIHSNLNNLKNIVNGRVYNEIQKIEMLDEINSCSDPDIIYDKFYNNLSLKDIAIKHNISKETVRYKLKKNLNSLKLKLSSV